MPLNHVMPFHLRNRRASVAVRLALLCLFMASACSAQAISAAQWISASGASDHAQQVVLFRKIIHLDAVPTSYTIHVTADNRFWLFVNGQRVGEGPARGDQAHWRYESFDLRPYLHRGTNVLGARVWNYGPQAPAAQISVRTGFLLWSASPSLSAVNTNASWSARVERGWSASFQGYPAAPGERIDSSLLDPLWDSPHDTAPWAPATLVSQPLFANAASSTGDTHQWHLVADTLPHMEYLPTSAGQVIRSTGLHSGIVRFPGQPIQIAAHSHASILLDRSTLTTAYPELIVGGGAGAKVRITYAEALVDKKGAKGDRNDVAQKHMDPAMLHDEFLPDGSARCIFSPTWWRAWRFLQIDIDTNDQSLSVLELNAHFSAYPLKEKATFYSSDPDLERIWNVSWRTHRLNAHETHMDCPYWEQLQYVGDTRIESLIDFAMSGDDRLAKQALLALADSGLPEGLTQSRYPATGVQVIPPFSLLWVGMMHDYWMYRPDAAFLRELLPLSRSVIDWFATHQRPDGMLGKLPQNGFAFWNFVDWSFAPIGAPPEDADGGSVSITLQFLAALRDAADLEEAFGDSARAASYRSNASRISAAVYQLAWDSNRQLLADTPARSHFSQHANILGVILDVIPAPQQKQVMTTILADELGTAPNTPQLQPLTTASYYFRFYLARALDHAGMGDLYLKTLGPWKHMLALGLTTWAETPEPTRSDAHDWSSHPNFDMLTILAGIHPDAPGFKHVRIAPHLEGLTTLVASMPHESGAIRTTYRRTANGVIADIALPTGLNGTFAWKGKSYPLHQGEQVITLR